MIEVGKSAPAFKLPNQDGKNVTLGDYKGQYVVLYFYPKDDTPGCTVEACDFTPGLRVFTKLDAVVLGCSADAPESHRKFIQKHKLKIALLSDVDKKMMQQYGAYGEKTLYGRKFMGIIRSTVIVGPDGRVAHHWRKVKAAGHAEKVKEKLMELTGK